MAAPGGAAHSYYLGDLDPGRLRVVGTADAQRAAAQRLARSVTVLDAGDPDVVPGSTQLPDHRGAAGPAQVRAAVASYAQGWLSVPAPPLVLVLGVSNYGSHVTPEHGHAWGVLVDTVSADLGPRVDVRGGLDAEPAYGPPGQARAWVRAFVAASSRPFVDFGDCACTPGQALPGGWTLDDRVAVAAAGAVLPEQYRTSGIDLRRWAALDARAVATRGRPLDVLGVLTETRACLGPPARECTGIDLGPTAALVGLSAALGRPVGDATDIGYLAPPPPVAAAPAPPPRTLLVAGGAGLLLAAGAVTLLVVRRRRA